MASQIKAKAMTTVLMTTFILIGCVHTDEMKPSDLQSETNCVKVRITQEDISTRAGIDPQTHVSSSDPLFLSNGFLYFTDSNGNILLFRKIDKDAQTSSGNIISLTELKSTGVIIENVSGASKNCYVFMNLPATAAFDDTKMTKMTGSISSIENLVLSTKDLYDPTGGIRRVPLQGKGAITSVSNMNYGLEAKVDLAAVGSRLEISKLSTVPSESVKTEDGTPYEITSYKVAGIFVNRFFATSQLGGAAIANSFIRIGDNKANFTNIEETDSPYTAYNELYTYSPSGIPHNGTDAPNVYTPLRKTTEDVWAFNVFPNDTPGINTAAYVPHIIIWLAELTCRPVGNTEAEAETMLTDQFVTVSGYLANNTELTYLQRGWVYNFANVQFSMDVVSPLPETNVIHAKATVTLVPWIIQEVEPKL
jgi:hypothetical protein